MDKAANPHAYSNSMLQPCIVYRERAVSKPIGGECSSSVGFFPGRECCGSSALGYSRERPQCAA